MVVVIAMAVVAAIVVAVGKIPGGWGRRGGRRF